MDIDKKEFELEIKGVVDLKKYDKTFSFTLNEWVQQISYRLDLVYISRMNSKGALTESIKQRLSDILTHGVVPFDPEYLPVPFDRKFLNSDYNGSSISKLSESAEVVIDILNGSEDCLIEGKGFVIDYIQNSEAIEINFNHSDEKIISDFSIWLENKRNKKPEDQKKLSLKEKIFNMDKREQTGYPEGLISHLNMNKVWTLDDKKVANKRNGLYKKNPTRSRMHNWASNLILPYFDIGLIYDFMGVQLTSSTAAEILSQGKFLGTEDKVKQTIKPLCETIITPQYLDFIASLNLQKRNVQKSL